MKKINLDPKKMSWVETKEEERKTPPFKIIVLSDTGEGGEVKEVYGRCIGNDKNHIRFGDPKEEIAYIRGNAPDNFRLKIHDQSKDIIALGVEKLKKKDREGKPEDFYLIKKFTFIKEEEIS